MDIGGPLNGNYQSLFYLFSPICCRFVFPRTTRISLRSEPSLPLSSGLLLLFLLILCVREIFFQERRFRSTMDGWSIIGRNWRRMIGNEERLGFRGCMPAVLICMPVIREPPSDTTGSRRVLRYKPRFEKNSFARQAFCPVQRGAQLDSNLILIYIYNRRSSRWCYSKNLSQLDVLFQILFLFANNWIMINENSSINDLYRSNISFLGRNGTSKKTRDAK